jgi:hypothetical protein
LRPAERQSGTRLSLSGAGSPGPDRASSTASHRPQAATPLCYASQPEWGRSGNI